MELLVVIVIIALMSAFVAPRMLGSLTHMSLKTTAKSIAAVLRYARSQAVTEQSAYLVRFDLEKNQVRVSRLEDAQEDLDESGEAPAAAARVYAPPEGIVMSKSDEAGELPGQEALEITFYPDGNSSGGEVLLTDAREKHYLVRVDFISGTVGADAHE
jgi:general secretion pathway protein H